MRISFEMCIHVFNFSSDIDPGGETCATIDASGFQTDI